MNGSRSKKIRRMVYGSEGSPRYRRYVQGSNGVVTADIKRRMYQLAKGEWLRRER